MDPIDRLTRWLGRHRDGVRHCHVCEAEVTKNALQVEGFYACSEEHADDIRRERAW